MSQNYSPGEDVVQERFGTFGRATAFRKSQMLTHLNPMMEQFIQSQEMIRIQRPCGLEVQETHDPQPAAQFVTPCCADGVRRL